MDFEINVNAKFNVFTKIGNEASSDVLRVVPFDDPLQLIPLLLAIVGLIAWFE